jgi:outer membrane protein OmpA-like peptidoglycan-associated protein
MTQKNHFGKMNNRTIFLFFLGLVFCNLAITQVKNQVQPGGCDCNSAEKISVLRSSSFGPTTAPIGKGKINEISSNKSAVPVFEQEHNVSWYLLTITFDGELGIDIIPNQSQDDYDFIIYSYTDSSTCDKIASKSVQPIRSNLSRSQNRNHGKTGLSYKADSSFVNAGPGDPFSKSLSVKKGQRYLLVVDNLYSKGGGHKIEFYSISNYLITGKVVTLPIQQTSQILLMNESNDTLLFDSTPKDGTFNKSIWLNDYEQYNLLFESDSCFSTVQCFTPISQGKKAKIIVSDTLYRIVKGRSVKLENVYFQTGSATLDAQAINSLKSLLFMMKTYPKMEIRVEGHVNGDSTLSPRNNGDYFRQLSLDRANAVANYLVANGISASRMSTVGFGASRPVIPNARTQEGMRQNMRVEILIINF